MNKKKLKRHFNDKLHYTIYNNFYHSDIVSGAVI
jgi:hypothetical protein